MDRREHLARVQRLLRQSPVVALLGARQVGNSTLARQVAVEHGGPVRFFDLEDSRDVAELESALLALEPLRGLVVLDEVQLRPGLFSTPRVLADRPRKPARFLFLGRASPELLRQGSETLAGRVAFHDRETRARRSRWRRLRLERSRHEAAPRASGHRAGT